MRETEILRGLGKARAKRNAQVAEANSFAAGLVPDNNAQILQKYQRPAPTGLAGAIDHGMSALFGTHPVVTPAAPPAPVLTAAPSPFQRATGSGFAEADKVEGYKNGLVPAEPATPAPRFLGGWVNARDKTEQAARKALDPDKYVDGEDKVDSGGQPAQEAKPYATGTPFVEGPGTGTSDSVPARLSHGEAVLPAKTVAKIGPQNIARLIQDTNDGVAPKTGLRGARHFAAGEVPDAPGVVQGAKNLAQNAWNGTKNFASSAADTAKGWTQPAAAPAAPADTAPIDYDKPTYQRNATSTGRPVADGLAESAPKTLAPQSVAKPLAPVSDWQAVKNAGTNLATGGKSALPEAATAASGWANKIKSAVGLGDVVAHGLSAVKDFHTGNYGQSAAEGMQALGGGLAAPVRNVLGQADLAATSLTGTDLQGNIARAYKAGHDHMFGEDDGSLADLTSEAQKYKDKAAAEGRLGKNGIVTGIGAPGAPASEPGTAPTSVAPASQTLAGSAANNAGKFIDGTGVPSAGTGFMRNNTTGAVTQFDTPQSIRSAAAQNADPREAYRQKLMADATDPNAFIGRKQAAQAALGQMDSADKSLEGGKYASDATLLNARMQGQMALRAANAKAVEDKVRMLNADEKTDKEGNKSVELNGPKANTAMQHLIGTLAGIQRDGQPMTVHDLNDQDVATFQKMHEQALQKDGWNDSWSGKFVNAVQGNHPHKSGDMRNYGATSEDNGAVWNQYKDRVGNNTGMRAATTNGDWIKPTQDYDMQETLQQQLNASAHPQTMRSAASLPPGTTPAQARALDARYRSAEVNANKR